MRKILTTIFLICLITSFAACGQAVDNNTATEQFPGKIKVSVASLDELNDKIMEDIDSSTAKLNDEWIELNSSIKSYEQYKSNAEKIEAFYGKVLEETHQLCLRMYIYSLEYARFIMDSDRSFGEKYDDFEELYDNVYDDAGDDIYDAIYDGILDEMYDAFYGGLLEDAYEEVAYGEWSEEMSDAYDIWSDTKSDVYDEWSDMKSDIYDFCSDMREEMWDKDQERADKKYNDFLEDVKRLTE